MNTKTTNIKNFKFLYLFLVISSFLTFPLKSFSAQFFNNVALCFEDRLNWDHDGNDLCLRISMVMDDTLAGDPITYLITPVSVGAADDLELQVASTLGATSITLHEDSNRVDLAAGSKIYGKNQFFISCSGVNFVNVGTGLTCDPNPRAVTVTDHSLSVSSDSDLVDTVLDVFQLRNKTQSITISKANVGFMFVLPDDELAIVKEHNGTWYDNWNLSTANCDPSVGMGSCNLNTLKTDTNAIVRSSLGHGVNKTPKDREEFDIAQSSGTTANYSSGGKPIFAGSRWSVKTVSDKANITSYFNEGQLDGASVNRTGYIHYKHRHICEIINCSGGGGGGSSCAPGNAPCDYSFCHCHRDSTGCQTGDANGDNVCWWDSSSSVCKSADIITNSSDCTSKGFYWTGSQCVGGNSSSHDCTYKDCTYMGNAAGTGSCVASHRHLGTFTVSAHNSTANIGTSAIQFSNNPTWGGTFPFGEIPEFGNCGSGGDCQSGLSCDYGGGGSGTWSCR